MRGPALSRRTFVACLLAGAAPKIAAGATPANPDVVIVGAGAAGIAAARALIGRGFEVLVIEAAERIGGRAFTESAVFGAPYDHGCASLQGPAGPPHVPFAREIGFTLHDHGAARDALFMEGRRATAQERRARDRAYERVSALLDGAAGDVSAGSLVTERDPMTAVAATWIGPLDMGVDLDDLSTADWAAGGGYAFDYLVKEGLGALVARLGAGLPVSLSTPALAVDWSGDGVSVETPRGAIQARACIVTVSTGVLASGAIRFTPALPAEKEAAIEGVPMGCLAKIGLSFGGERFGLSPNDYLSYGLEGTLPAEACFFLTWPTGHDYAVGYVGGGFGRALAAEGEAAAAAFALDAFAGMVGNDARRKLVKAHLSEWESNPLTLGAYSAARPGRHADRATLARPLGDRVFFAGEAVAEGYFALCTGAHLSGEAAAEEVAAALSAGCGSCDARGRQKRRLTGDDE